MWLQLKWSQTHSTMKQKFSKHVGVINLNKMYTFKCLHINQDNTIKCLHCCYFFYNYLAQVNFNQLVIGAVFVWWQETFVVIGQVCQLWKKNNVMVIIMMVFINTCTSSTKLPLHVSSLLTSPAGGPQVVLHSAVVRETGSGGSDLSSHVANGAHS